MNVLRGFLVLLTIVNHFTPSLARRSLFVQANEKYLAPLFNWATPGFAFAFGITLGFVYYPQYRIQPRRARSLLLRGAFMVGVAAAMFGGAGVAMMWVHPVPGPHDDPIATVLTYYCLALATGTLWFRAISRSRSAVLSALALAIASAAIQQLGLRLSSSADASTVWLLLFGKFGYFGLSIGALAGLALGIELKRSMRVARWYAPLSLGLVLSGAALSLRQDLTSAWFFQQLVIEPWKWVFYGGLSLASVVALDRGLAALPARGFATSAVRGFAVIGQLALPLFVLHFFVRYLGDLCTWMGMPAAARFSVEFGALFLVTYVLARRTFLLFYGEGPSPVREPAARADRALARRDVRLS